MQVAALAVASGNGVLLKGGKEAVHTNAALHRTLTAAVQSGSHGRVSGKVLGLVEGREDIPALLKLHKDIDLVIPRGSNSMVQSIMRSTRIPTLGHADGICHMCVVPLAAGPSHRLAPPRGPFPRPRTPSPPPSHALAAAPTLALALAALALALAADLSRCSSRCRYIDEHADVDKAIRLMIDSKCDYPAACNALETLLLHEAHVASGAGSRLLEAARGAGIQLYGGPRAAPTFELAPCASLHVEYGELAMTVELVSDTASAVEHINKYGSGHTDVIVTEDATTAETFLQGVDSADVFHNCSSRFADGFRLGLGAEVSS